MVDNTFVIVCGFYTKPLRRFLSLKVAYFAHDEV